MVAKKDVYDCYLSSGIEFDRVYSTFRRAEKWYPTYVKDGRIISRSIPGKLFASVLFPEDMDYSRRTDTIVKYPVFKVEKGVILPDSAPICKMVVGERGQTVQHMLWKEYSPDRSLQFFSEFEFLSYAWFPRFGFSIGLSDCVITDPKAVEDALTTMMSEVNTVIATTPDPATCEHKISSILSSAMNTATRLAKESMNGDDGNAFYLMRQSGAKGSIINCAQVSTYVGQQNISGRRVVPTLSGGTRTLPHFRKGDNSPVARGFIFNSYLNGLTPPEMFFHGAAGRSGISDTSTKTAKTGYIQKRIARQLEDLRAYFDGTVRSANGSIIQFMYGDDGMNPKQIYAVPGVKYPFFVNPGHIASRLNYNSAGVSVHLEEAAIELFVSYIASGIPGAQTVVTDVVTRQARATLVRLLKDVKITIEMAPELCSQIRDAFEASKIEDGEMVGLIATHAIGEKVTQMTLDSFHSTGNSAMDIQLGVPRLEELIRASQKSITPTCSVHIDDERISENANLISELEKKNMALKDDSPEYAENYKAIQELKMASYNIIRHFCSQLELVTVESLLQSIEMEHLYDDYDSTQHASPIGLVEYKKHEFSWWETFSGDCEITPRGWVIMLTFDKGKLFKSGITLEEIAARITSHLNDHAACVVSPMILCQIAVYVDFSEIQEYIQTVMELPDGTGEGMLTCNNTAFFTARDVVVPMIRAESIRGFHGIEHAFPREDKKTKLWIVDTKGTNIVDIMGLPGVDIVRTTSNDLYQIYETFGIEATKKFLFREINAVLAGYGIYVNPRHLDLLVCRMTHTGELASCTEKGISRDSGPIAKLSFERPMDNAVLSSTFGENDFLQSIASSIMYGNFPRVGTGVVDVHRDESVL